METVLSRTALMEHILTLVDDPDSHVYELGAMLEWEPSLSNSVTRKASAWYGLPAPDCTLNLALALLGSRVVKETVKHAITNRATRDLVISVFDVGGFWGAVAAVEHESGPTRRSTAGSSRSNSRAPSDHSRKRCEWFSRCTIMNDFPSRRSPASWVAMKQKWSG